MRRKLVLLVVMISAIAAVVIYREFLSTGPGMKSREVAHELTATELYDAFDMDEAAAEQKYLGQVLAIEGKVSSITKDESGNYAISLETSGFGLVKCTLEKGYGIGSLTEQYRGKLRLKGECLGFLLDVQIGEAIILP
ncbi:OB-fold protein [Roseivirga sp.]|uniref:OB-fold protein n=1 Tax=Roseivirga sp. TaxID=1964215 RepID=UPI003B529436